jgi:hypothetical protein
MSVFSVLAITSVWTGCSSSSTDPTSVSDSGSGTSFSTSVYPIIEKHCIFCHGPTADGGAGSGIEFGKLDMGTEANAYANLVGTTGGVAAAGAACATSSHKRVVPGDPTDSLLYNKLVSNDGDGGTLSTVFCGHAMPLDKPAIDASDLQTIDEWISQGANP